MTKRLRRPAWAKTFQRSFVALTRLATQSCVRTRRKARKFPLARRTPAPAAGSWTAGIAMGASGARRYRLYRPPELHFGERLPLMVMLHGCDQDAATFAASTRMNRVALRERFLVLYPEQDRLSNSQGCWNWFDTRNGRAYGEVALIMTAIDQVCLSQPVDRTRVSIAGMSAGASMAALLVTRHPERFKALVMHSGIPPGTAHSAMSALGAMHGHRPTLALAAGAGTMSADWPPLLVIHGSADTVVSPHNGQAAALVWAQAAGAHADTARIQQRGQRYPMSITDFKRGGRTVATLVVVEGLAHAWSGGSSTLAYGDAHGPDASRMVWAFAARQFRSLDGSRAASARRHANAT
jgi:poly(hydroxyalkanoate) depolymerase family esterase